MNLPKTLDPAAVNEAVQWLVTLHSGTAREKEHEACRQWIEADPAHRQAWQLAQDRLGKLGLVPPALAAPALMRRDRGGRRKAVQLLVAGGLAAPLGWLAYRETPLRYMAADYRTAAGEIRATLLPDGSRLSLDTSSAVDMQFTDTSRTLLLRAGQIYIETAPDPARRPFVVQTPHGRFRALGTRFSLRLLDTGEPSTRLTVLEHSVEVSPNEGGASRVFAAGSDMEIDALGHMAVRRDAAAVDGQSRPGWVSRMLFANDMRLDVFLSELARYRSGIVRCDPAVAGLRLSGTFPVDDTDYSLALVGEILPVGVVLRTRFWVTVVPAPAKGS